MEAVVGNSVTETDVAMEPCKEVQMEEGASVIHVEESTNFYAHLRLFLLASTWFPRPLGVCLWSALHVLLVLYEALMLLILYSTGFVLAVSWDALLVYVFINMVMIAPFMIICAFLSIIIVAAVAWLWLVLTCQVCTMSGPDLRRFILTAGGTLGPHGPQPVPGVEGGAAAADGPKSFVQEFLTVIMTPMFVRHVIHVSLPYRRAQLEGLCREIVPCYNTTAI